MRQEDTAIFTAYEGFIAPDLTEPEKKLMLAVLRLAMDDITKRGQTYRDARKFFLQKESEYLYSFPVICQELRISRNKILEHIGLIQAQNHGLPSA